VTCAEAVVDDEAGCAVSEVLLGLGYDVARHDLAHGFELSEVDVEGGWEGTRGGGAESCGPCALNLLVTGWNCLVRVRTSTDHCQSSF
jgi:hypothetical protein